MTTASDYFGSMVESYDSLIRRAVPRYAEMTERLLDYLPAPVASRAERILELGCGTGNLSLRLAARYPSATITLVDAAPEMIEITRTRLRQSDASAVDRVTFITERFEDLKLPRATFDFITSCISLHHVSDKARLYRALFSAVQPRGTFRFADQLRGSTDLIHNLNWQRWLEFCRQNDQCTEEEVQSLLDHAAAHDHYTPLREHFALLEEAGFTHCDCVWRNLIWGIITAERS
jgi:tRNA (cmo5U34)-methyltransferase